MSSPLAFANRATRAWFEASFEAPTLAQKKGWPAIASGASTLLLAPTGSGKTLSAFLVAIDRLCFGPPPTKSGVRVLYVTPLKALGVDVERNLRAPLAGIRATAQRLGISCRDVSVGVRSGDTPAAERERLRREPPEILITTPESLYLMLASRASEGLRTVETLIVDEIHNLVPTKRGVHLALSLERLEAIRTSDAPSGSSGSSVTPMQRIGLSATQRPLDEVARFLGGLRPEGEIFVPRDVTLVDAKAPKAFEVSVEVPVEDLARLDLEPPPPRADTSDVDLDAIDAELGLVALDADPLGDPMSAPIGRTGPTSVWPAIHPRLVALIRAHRSTMIFVNSRRLAERLSDALNELAGDPNLCRAHHGSMAKDMRAEVEDRLKRGLLPAIVATSSLELGIDVGAVDLVIQIEAPPSVASGIQRIGRAGHQVGAVSRGRIFPKYRGDLLACAAVVQHLREGKVEATFYPRNPLDVLAQQLVALVVERGEIRVDEAYALTRRAAPFAELPRRSFEGVLDMLSGRYPSERFGELRARLTYDRIEGVLRPRKGARLLAVANAGTIPDRGLYGVFLAGQEKPIRVGELDEEMVFESREGEIFLLGASSWRIEEITHDRVLVSPAPGEPGKMPFWRGDRPGRPVDFGRAIGELARTLLKRSDDEAVAELVERHGLDARAADNLVRYLRDQENVSAVPTDRRIVIERFLDELGDPVVAVLTPFGTPVHAPWATAVQARLSRERGIEADVLHADDGIVFRFVDVDEPPEDAFFLPDPDEVERLVTERLSSTSLFASHFRENAARALLLPRKRPGQRTPLWAQRRKSAQLLQVASEANDFPIVLETYREVLRDVFDLGALQSLLRDVGDRRVRVSSVETKAPSPFAAALLFHYVASFMYEGDAPLAERRAQALTLDHAQLRALLGEPELRELLDADAVVEVERQLLRLDRTLGGEDDVHDLLLAIGDLSRDELHAYHSDGPLDAWLDGLLAARRLVELRVGGELRLAAVEDVARFRDALGVVPPRGLPQSLLGPVDDPLGQLVGRYARTHGPFTADECASRLGLGVAPVKETLARLANAGRLAVGELLPTSLMRERGRRGGHEHCDVEVLRRIKRRSLAKLRAEVEPVEPTAYQRFLLQWQGVGVDRRGLDALVGVIEQLQGAPIAASDLESRVLPARLARFDPRDLDELCATGEVIWRGLQPLGEKDGRIALYLADHYPLLAPREPDETRAPRDTELAARVRELLAQRGAVFFRDLVRETARMPAELHETLWDLVWAGEVTNDTLAPLRSLRAPARRSSRRTRLGARTTAGPAGSEGRWSLLPPTESNVTQRLEALATQLLERHGVLVREAVHAELRALGLPGGFSAVYPVLKAMEETGRVRRGYFVSGLGAAQFALPGAEDRLRDRRHDEETLATLLAADDPANAYGAALSWPSAPEGSETAKRQAGARVVLHRGALVGFLGRGGKSLTSFLPEQEPERTHAKAALVEAVGRGEGIARGRRGGAGVELARVDGGTATSSGLAEAFVEGGFVRAGETLFRRVE
ncbi:MAG: DEAD/DEAH box helicase [Polyangiales bacterium]